MLPRSAVSNAAHTEHRGRAEFWSSVGGHAFQHALLRELGRSGWSCAERCLVPHETYRHARTRLARGWMRFRTYGLYPFEVARHFLQAPADVVPVVASNTFYAPWVAVKTAPPEVPVIHWVLDLYPDALEAAGKLERAGLPARLLRQMMRDTFRRAHANVFLGQHLLRHAEQSVGPIPRSEVIPIGADGAPFRQTPPQPRPAGGAPLRVLYCGNMGYMHDVETIAGVLERGLPRGMEMAFCGNGAGYSSLALRVAGMGGNPAVRFSGNLPDAEWVETMRAADVAFVTMRPGAEKVVMPSKAYSAMVAGQAILAVCPAESDLADLVRAHDLGWVVEPGDGEELHRVLAHSTRESGEVFARRQRAWEAGHRLFDQSVIARRWTELFERVRHARAAAPLA